MKLYAFKKNYFDLCKLSLLKWQKTQYANKGVTNLHDNYGVFYSKNKPSPKIIISRNKGECMNTINVLTTLNI